MKVAVLGAVLLLSACAPLGRAPQAELEGTAWELTSLSGRPPLAGVRITLAFERGRAGGYGGCNTYGGRYHAAAPNLEIRNLETTLIGCEAPVEQQEIAYYEALGRVSAYRLEGGRLELTGAGGVPTLVYTAE